MQGKIIILSAPSGSGKSTIISHLVKDETLRLGFSISATSRAPRGEEKHGREYFFLSLEDFRKRVERGEFVEWEEVYPGICYGTLESEINRITANGGNLVMDVDVKGAINIKKRFGNRAITIFIMPPDIETLSNRLKQRGTDTPEHIVKRLEKAEYEMSFADKFDRIVVNDELEKAVSETNKIIKDFIDKA